MEKKSPEYGQTVQIRVSINLETYKRLCAIAYLDDLGRPTKAAASVLESGVAAEAEARPQIDESVRLSDEFQARNSTSSGSEDHRNSHLHLLTE